LFRQELYHFIMKKQAGIPDNFIAQNEAETAG